MQGTAGTGKSWLVENALASVLAERPDTVLLRASGHSAETGLPYAGLHQLLLGQSATTADLPAPQRIAIDQALARGPLNPSERFSAAAGLYGLLVTLSEHRPVVVFVDDAQLVDPATMGCLTFASRRLHSDPVTMIAAWQDDAWRNDASRGSALLTSPDEAIVLQALNLAESRSLLRRLHPELAPGLRDALLHSSGGLPVALCEGAADLTDDQRNGSVPSPTILPIGPSLTRLYARRIGALSGAERLALLIATVQPLQRFRLLAALTEVDLTTESLNPSIAAGLLDQHAAPAHSTVRAAIRLSCSDSEIECATRAVASALADEPHRQVWLLAELPESESSTELATLWKAAGDDAERRGAWAEAATAREQQAHSTTGEPSRIHLRAAVDCATRAGRPDRALPWLDQLAESATDPNDRLRLEAQRLMVRSWWRPHPVDEAAVHQLLRAHPRADDAVRAQLWSTLAVTAILWGDHATALRAGDASDAIHSGSIVDHLIRNIAGLVSGRIGASEALRGNWIDGVTEDCLLDPTAPVYLAAFLLALTDAPQEATVVAHRLAAAAQRVGDLGHLALATALFAVIAERAGDVYAARAQYTSAIGLCLDTDFTGPVVHIQLRYAQLLAAIGDEAGCTAALHAAAETGRTSAVIEHLRIVAEGRLALSTGRCAEAAELLQDAEYRQVAMSLNEPGYAASSGDLVDALWRLHRYEQARAVLNEYAALAATANRHSALAVVSRGRGMLDTPTAIDEHFAAAHREHDLAPDRYQRARTDLSWGMCLRRNRRRRDARVALRRALVAFHELGAAPWAVMTAAELAACGERRRTAWPAVNELTPRELEVAIATSDGASNPEAAAALCISIRTVEDHLTKVYRKLGIGGRAELAAALHRPGQPAAAKI